jgi:hypothetical protein
MTVHVKLDDRLSILRAGDQFRRWNSLDDHRVCRVCERKFKGRQIEIRRAGGGEHTLHCPTLGCQSGPHQWVYARAPVVSEVTEQKWWRAGKQPARHPAEAMRRAQVHRV